MTLIKTLKYRITRQNPYLHAFYTNIKDNLLGHNHYTKFIIAGRSRSGSNFLRGLLNSHGHVIVYGELFGNPNSLKWDNTGYFQSTQTLDLLNKKPVTLLDKKIFRKYPRSILAVGFKIFYYHAQVEPWKPVWSYLQGNRDIKILHMKRKNYLKTHLSRKKAAINNSWVNTNGTIDPDNPIYLDYQECEEDFLKTRSQENEFDDMFRNHTKFDVIYEDLSHDYHKEIKRILEFLGVPFDEVHPGTHKQSSLPLHKAIVNYDELKEKFSGSEWGEFFEE